MHLGAYLSSPQDLARFNYTEQDLFKGVVDQRWRELMRFQIQRTRQVYAKAEKGISRLSPDARWPVGGADALQSDFDVIERNHYDVPPTCLRTAYARYGLYRLFAIAGALTIGVRVRGQEEKKIRRTRKILPCLPQLLIASPHNLLS